MNEKDSEKTDTKPKEKCGCDCGSSLGFLTLRLWLAVRAIMTGLEKYTGMKTSDVVVNVDGKPNAQGLTSSDPEKVYGLDYYHGVPDSMRDQFLKEPLIPEFALNIYCNVLGPVLIVLGVTLLLGIATRVSLFLQGLLYISLTVGLILLKQDAGIAWLGIHVFMIAFALCHVKDNKFALMKKW